MPDTSVMVAVMAAWHTHHEPSARALEARLAEGQSMVVATRTLVEAYSVLTRLPPPHRLSPEAAAELVIQGFTTDARVIGLPASQYKKLIARSAAAGVAGGRAYDAEIAACALHAGVDAFVTLNRRDFAVFPELEARLVVPDA